MTEMSIAYVPETGKPATLVSIRYNMSNGFMYTISNVDWTHKVDYSRTTKLTAKDVMQAIREFVYVRQRGRVKLIRSRITNPGLSLHFLRLHFVDENWHNCFDDSLKWDKYVYEEWANTAQKHARNH